MPKIPENAALVIDRLMENGYEAYIVGGCVRDSLLGVECSDFDITTSAKPEKVIELFEKNVPTGIQHGTVTVIIENEPIEVTTFRTEGAYNDSRHPENVEFVSDLKEDLSRRDFTVNAIAYNKKVGIIDLFGGKSDLENKILRAVGDPDKRFREDALRILRLFRFASQLDFKIEENTLKSALELKDGLKNISRERIFAELQRSVNGKKPKAILPLINSGALEFLGITGEPDLSVSSQSPDLRLWGLIKSSENPVLVLKNLKASNRQIANAQNFIKLSGLEIKTKEDIKNALFLTDEQTVRAFFEYYKKDTAKLDEIIENNEPYLISHLAVTGEDLKELGFFGKEIGEKLEALRQAVVKDPQKNEKLVLLRLTK